MTSDSLSSCLPPQDHCEDSEPAGWREVKDDGGGVTVLNRAGARKQWLHLVYERDGKMVCREVQRGKGLVPGAAGQRRGAPANCKCMMKKH